MFGPGPVSAVLSRRTTVSATVRSSEVISTDVLARGGFGALERRGSVTMPRRFPSMFLSRCCRCRPANVPDAGALCCGGTPAARDLVRIRTRPAFVEVRLSIFLGGGLAMLSALMSWGCVPRVLQPLRVVPLT